MIGISRAKNNVMRSRRITGQEACDWGIASDCVPDGELEAATDALADELRDFAPLAQRTAKKLLNDIEDPRCPWRSSSKASAMAACAARRISVKGRSLLGRSAR